MSDLINDPLIELLAIKLHEMHIESAASTVKQGYWLSMDDDEREIYRAVARGECSYKEWLDKI